MSVLPRPQPSRDVGISASAPKVIGVVVPVHDEEAVLHDCFLGLEAAAEPVARSGIDVRINIVLDGCRDASAAISSAFRHRSFRQRTGGRRGSTVVDVVTTGPGNVGKARALGFARLLDGLDDYDLEDVWLATTDADTVVPTDWLGRQLARRSEGVDAWAGTIDVGAWAGRSQRLAATFEAFYSNAQVGHVHGASMAFAARAYVLAGGFPPLATAEDHGLWQALGATGATRLHDRSCPVVTSGRRRARAPLGFAYFLDQLELGSTDHAPIDDLLKRSTGRP